MYRSYVAPLSKRIWLVTLAAYPQPASSGERGGLSVSTATNFGYHDGMQKNTASHFEIFADDPDKLAKFYTSMFDWQITPVPGMEYLAVHTAETDAQGMLKQPGSINGGIVKRPDGFRINGAVNYAMVDSIEQAAARAESLGA